MQSRLFRTFMLTASMGLALLASVRAAAPVEPPTVGDLKEEQRIILNAYLKRGEQFVSKSKEQLADNVLRASKENGFYAVELLARARAKLDQHPSRIEQARGIFGRATESTREELRKNLRENIDPRYFALQTRLENIAAQLAAKGDTSLQQALEAAKNGDTQGVTDIMRSQKIRPKGDENGVVEPAGPGANAPAANGTSPAASGTIAGIPGSSVTQSAPGQVSVSLPGKPAFNIPGTLSADGRYIDSAQYGKVDLQSGKTLPDGSTAFQTDKGVLVVGPDGSLYFIPKATLNPDGSATTADGTKIPLEGLHRDPATGALITNNHLSLNPSSGVATNPALSTSGQMPSGVKCVDENGNPITVDPDWENGEQRGVKREYLGGKGARLTSESKVTRKIVGAEGTEWKVKTTTGESRTWDLSISMGETKTTGGSLELTLTLVDAGGLTDFTVKSWEVVNASGARASVTPSSSNPGEATATFTQDGDYTFTVTGETSWGSAFRITGKGGVYR